MMTPVKFNLTQMTSLSFPAHHQKGFTLLEALVAFLILSIGMLGVASLQLMSVRAGHSAAFRTVAVTKVEDMFERIRNNPSEVLNYDDGATLANNNACNDYSGSVNSCLSAALVAYDKYEWQQELTASLSANIAVTTTITVTPPVAGTSPLSTVVITVNWDERDTETQAVATMSYSASADICGSTAC